MAAERTSSAWTTRAPARVRTLGPSTTAASGKSGLIRPAGEGSSPERTLKLNQRYRLLLGAADVAACGAALAIAIFLLGSSEDVSLGLALGPPLVVLIAKILGLYDRDELVLHKSTLDEAPRLFQLATVFTLTLWIAEAPLGMEPSRGGEVAILWGSLFLLLVASRFSARAVARHTTTPERCLMLGDPDACLRARRKIDASHTVNAEVVAEITSARIGESEVPMDLLAEVAAEHEIQRVIIAPRSTDHGDVLNLVRAVKSIGLNVSVLPRLLEIVGSSVVVDDIEGLRVLGVARFGLTRSSRFVKRSVDIVGATLGLILTAPILLVIAVAIKIGSPGPVSFRQPRIGRDGQVFEMLKFRSMLEGADELKEKLRELNEAPGLFKIADDPRINPVGRFLRSSSLDELPQLWNVLRGEMSLVGPRPLVHEDDSQIEGWDRHRLHLTPGMTGPWQVLGSTRIPLQEMVKLDYLYVATWSVWGDIKILLRTFVYVMRRKGL